MDEVKRKELATRSTHRGSPHTDASVRKGFINKWQIYNFFFSLSLSLGYHDSSETSAAEISTKKDKKSDENSKIVDFLVV